MSHFKEWATDSDNLEVTERFKRKFSYITTFLEILIRIFQSENSTTIWHGNINFRCEFRTFFNQFLLSLMTF